MNEFFLRDEHRLSLFASSRPSRTSPHLLSPLDQQAASTAQCTRTHSSRCSWSASHSSHLSLLRETVEPETESPVLQECAVQALTFAVTMLHTVVRAANPSSAPALAAAPSRLQSRPRSRLRQFLSLQQPTLSLTR